MSRPRSVFTVASVAAVTAVAVALQRPAGAIPAGGPQMSRPEQAAAEAAAPITSRGRDRGDRERRAQPPPSEAQPPQQKAPCPEDLWSLPVQIKGLACILLLPKPAE